MLLEFLHDMNVVEPLFISSWRVNVVLKLFRLWLGFSVLNVKCRKFSRYFVLPTGEISLEPQEDG